MTLSRRALIGGSAAVVGLASVGALTQGARIQRAWDQLQPGPDAPSGPVGPLVSGSFASTAMQRTIGWSISYPHGSKQGDALPVLITLHGRSGDHRSAFASSHYDRYLSAAVRGGVQPFAMVSVDGGNHTYYHRRADGVDPERMLLKELLPVLTARGLATERLGLHGISMGGYGALLLAERLGPSRVAVVAADSPAVWQRWRDSAKGAFDSPQDFAAHDVLAGSGHLRGIPARVTCGTADPFLPGVKALLRRHPAAEHEIGHGGHNGRWWAHTAPHQLAFVGRHLTP